MDFKERFRGRIGVISKKGVRFALLQPMKEKLGHTEASESKNFVIQLRNLWRPLLNQKRGR
jgi:hypothetical protein